MTFTEKLRELLKGTTKGPVSVAARQGDDWDSVVYIPNTPLEICQCFHDDNKDECESNTRLIAFMFNHASEIAALVEAAQDASSKIHDAHEGKINWRVDFAQRLDQALAALEERKG